MEIKYASKHRWFKDLSTKDPLEGFGDNAKAKLNSTIKKVADSEIRHIITPLTKELINQFTPLYQEQIGKKDNPRLFNIEERTLNKSDNKSYYEFLGIYENEQLIGGTIFSVRSDFFGIAFRAYANDWKSIKLQSKPAIYGEYLLAKYAIEINKTGISHGKDRNPYGYNANIGLAAFKLSVGCKPYKAKEGEYEMGYFDPKSASKDILLFEYPERAGERITKGYLITCRENEAKWQQVSKYPQSLTVETLYRD